MAGYIGSKAVNLSTTGADINGNANIDGDLSFRDNDKAIFGAGSDLQIYHDGSNSYVEDTATGSLILKGANVLVRDSSDNNIMKANDGGSAVLFYAGSSKLATTSTGVDITGTLTSDGLTVDGTPVRFNSTAPMLYFMETGVTDSNHRIRQNAGNLYFQKLSDDTNTATTRMVIDGGSGDISFYEDTGTTAKFLWDASAESLGIGTSSPARTLHVTRGDGTGTVAKIGNTGTSSAIIEFSDTSTTDTVSIGSVGNDLTLKSDDGDISLNTTGDPATASLYVERGGNVGIGTSSPAALLDLKHNSASTHLRLTENTSGNWSAFGVDTSDNLRIYVNTSEAMRIDSSGNVGINNTSPNTKLDIIGSSTNNSGVVDTLRLRNTGTSLNDGPRLQFTSGTSTSGAAIGSQGKALNSADLLFYTGGNTERMRLDASGDLLVGCTSLPSASVKGFGIDNKSTVNMIVTSTNTTSGDSHHRFFNPNGDVGGISTSGSATTYSTSSDHRLKENVVYDWDATTRLKQLKPARFNFIADADTTVDGFLAHEVQSVVPEAITGTHNEVDADGNPVYQGIDQSKLVPLLTAALQEALDEITDLKARVATLEAN